MKKYAYIGAGLAPLLVIAMFAFFGTPADRETAKPENRTTAQNPEHEFPGRGQSIRGNANTKKPDFPVAPEAADARERTNQAMVALGNQMNDKSRALAVEIGMNKRAPHLEALFKSWGISENDANTVLDIIKSRESNLYDFRKEMFQKGVTQSSAPRKKIEAEKAHAASRLISLLGRERYDEFAEVEARVFPSYARASRGE